VAAWEKHVQEWKPPSHPDVKNYKSGRYMNEHFSDSVLRTEEEQETDPYPDNLQLRCHETLYKGSRGRHGGYAWTMEEFGYPCRILGRKEREGRHYYTVEIAGESEDGELEHTERKDAPREAIAFFDVPFTSDIHISGAFRHPIGIPDDMFPQQWKDLLAQ